jgi:hypothetical protein
MVGYNIYGHIVVMEIILAWLWLIGVVAFLILLGYRLCKVVETRCFLFYQSLSLVIRL